MIFGLSRLTVQIIASSAILSVLVGSCVVRDRSLMKRGATKVIAASKQQGAKANEINSDVRNRAAEPGAFERLLKDSCRDC